MNIKKVLIPIITLAALLTGCNGDNNSSSTSSDDDSFVELTTDPISAGQIGGSLIEICVGQYLEAGTDYTCSFVPSGASSRNTRLENYDDKVCTLEKVNDGAFIVHALKQGDSIIKIYDGDDMLVFRDVIHVRRVKTREEIEDYVYNIDKWVSTGIFGNYSLTFTNDNPFSGVVAGSDDMGSEKIVFEAKFMNELVISEFSFYSYAISINHDESSTTRTYTFIDIAVTGFDVMIYYTDGLVEMFMPA